MLQQGKKQNLKKNENMAKKALRLIADGIKEIPAMPKK